MNDINIALALLVDVGPTKRSVSPKSCFGYPEYSDVLPLWRLCVPFASDGDPSYGCTTGIGVFVLFRQIVYLALIGLLFAGTGGVAGNGRKAR